MVLPKNFDPNHMIFEDMTPESKVSDSAARLKDEKSEKNTEINNEKKIKEVRDKLKQRENPKDTKELSKEDKKEKELSGKEIKTLVEQHMSNAENNNTIASIAKLSKLRDPRD